MHWVEVEGIAFFKHSSSLFFEGEGAPFNMWDLSYLNRDETCSLRSEGRSSNRWTTEEVLKYIFNTSYLSSAVKTNSPCPLWSSNRFPSGTFLLCGELKTLLTTSQF